jgi:hypothetical protein
MQLGGLAGLTALTMGIGQEKTIKEANSEPAGDSVPMQVPESVPPSPISAE